MSGAMTHDDGFTGTQEQASLSVMTMLPPESDGPPPGYAAPAERSHGIQTIVLAAATVLALTATLGVGVLWSANRNLAADVDAAIAQTVEAQNESEALRAAIDDAPDAEALAALVGRIDTVEDSIGEPAADTGSGTLQTRVQDVSRDLNRLEESVRDDRATAPDALTSADLSGIRSEVSTLRSAVNGMQASISTLCWALPYQDTVNASC